MCHDAQYTDTQLVDSAPYHPTMKPRKDPTSLSTQLPHSHSHSHGQPHHRILIDKSNDPVFIPEPRSRSAFGFTAPWSSSRRSFPGMGMGMGGGHSGGRVKDEWTDLGSGSGSGSAGRRGWRDVLRVYHSHPVLSHHVSSVGSNQPLPIIVIPTPSNTDKPPPPHPPPHPLPPLPPKSRRSCTTSTPSNPPPSNPNQAGSKWIRRVTSSPVREKRGRSFLIMLIWLFGV